MARPLRYRVEVRAIPGPQMPGQAEPWYNVWEYRVWDRERPIGVQNVMSGLRGSQPEALDAGFHAARALEWAAGTHLKHHLELL